MRKIRKSLIYWVLLVVLLTFVIVQGDPSQTACANDADCTGTNEACGADSVCNCDVGYTTDNSGDTATGCTACTAGRYSDTIEEGTGTCTIAPAGYFTVDAADAATSTAAVSITQASAGYYTVDSGNTATSSGAVNQREVDDGYYACDDPADNDGTGVSAGAIAQCSCPSGYFSNDNTGYAACEAAAEGYYAVDSGSSATSSGAVNSAQVPSGSYACKNGDTDGTGVNTAADDACLCPRGTFSLAGYDTCTSASTGYYTVDANNNACDVDASCSAAVNEVIVTAGNYACDDTTDSDGIGVTTKAIAECVCPTEQNFHGSGSSSVLTQSNTGATQCYVAPTGAPSGQPTSVPSSKPSNQPTRRPSGQPSVQPTSLPSGQPTSYPSSLPSGQPTSLPSGQPSVQPTSLPSNQPTSRPSGQPSVQPTSIPSGQPTGDPTTQPSNQPTANPTARPVCPGGQYLDVPTMTCTDCPAGTASMNSGAESISTCVACVDGEYSEAGATTCLDCGIGTYSSASAGMCTSCGPGMETAAVRSTVIGDCIDCGTGRFGPGATGCVDCAVGKYADTAGAVVCTACEAGFYTDTTATVTCVACEAGKFAGAEGSTICDDCAAGSYAVAGSAVCILCPGGTSVKEALGVNLAACLNCAAGSYSEAGGLCLPCAAGSYAVAGTADVCTNCPVGRYAGQGGGRGLDFCVFCPEGTSVEEGQGGAEADCANCAAGTYADGGETVAVCTNCLVGTYSAEGAGQCTLCPLGTYNDEEGLGEIDITVCKLCEVAFYADNEGMEVCTVCPNGRLTPFEGAFDVEQCVSPAINFVTAWVIAGVLIPFSMEYTIHGRYHRIAFLREERVSKKLVKDCRSLMTNMYYYVAKASAERIEDTSSRLLKTWVFLLVGFFLTITLTVLYFVLTMSTIFFRSMILWRNFSIPIPFDDIIEGAMAALAFMMSFEEIQLLFVPFVLALEAIANLDIDLSAVNVTCNGALAPIELFFNLIILGLAIIIIESDYQIFRALTFASTTDKFLEMITQPLYRSWAYREEGTQAAATWKGFWTYAATVLAVIGASAISSVDIFQGVLQYVMSFVNVESFVEDQWMHAHTPECNDVPGYIMFDTYIAFVATIEFYLLAIPGVYELSKVLVPGIPKFIDYIEDVSSKRDPKESMLHWIKYTSVIMPDLLLAGFSSLWIASMRNKTPAADFFNVGAKKPVSVSEEADEAAAARTMSNEGKATEKQAGQRGQGNYREAGDVKEVSMFEMQAQRRQFIFEKQSALQMPSTTSKGDETDHNIDDDRDGMEGGYGSDASPPFRGEGGDKALGELVLSDEETKEGRRAGIDVEGLLDNKLSLPPPAPVQDPTQKNKARDTVKHHHVHSFRVVSAGAEATSHDRPGLYLARPGYSVKLWSCFPINVVRGFVLVRINRENGRLIFIKTYDVHGNGRYSGGRTGATLARDLNESTLDCIVVIFSKGKCAQNRLDDDSLPTAIARCGGSEEVFNSEEFKDDSCYTLVGIPSCGENNGFELLQNGREKAIIDINFEVTLKGWKMKEVHAHTQMISRSFFLNEKSYLLSTLRRRTALENARWLQRQASTMPSYFTLCKLEYHEMMTWTNGLLETNICQDNCAWFYPIVPFILVLFCITGFGHFLTTVGRKAWIVVIWKYYKFILLCLGVWTDDLVDLYKVHEYARNFSVVWEKPVRRMNRKEYNAYRRQVLFKGHGVDNIDDLKTSFDNSLARRITTWIASIGDEGKSALSRAEMTMTKLELNVAGDIVDDADVVDGEADVKGGSKTLSTSTVTSQDDGPASSQQQQAKREKEKKFYEESRMMQELQQSELKRKMRNDYSQIVYALVATRGVILQLASLLATLSIFAGTLASTPTFVFSEGLRDNLPELIITDAFVDARTEEQEVHDETEVLKAQISIYQDCVPNPETHIDPRTGRVAAVSLVRRQEIDRINKESIQNMKKLIEEPPREVDEWIVFTMGIVYLVTESRLFAFLFNLYKFTLTVGVLFSNPTTLRIWMLSAVVIIVPFAFVSVLKVNVTIGKAVDITDDDIRHALSCIGLEFLFTKYITDVTKGGDTTDDRDGHGGEEDHGDDAVDSGGMNETGANNMKKEDMKKKDKKKKKNKKKGEEGEEDEEENSLEGGSQLDAKIRMRERLAKQKRREIEQKRADAEEDKVAIARKTAAFIAGEGMTQRQALLRAKREVMETRAKAVKAALESVSETRPRRKIKKKNHKKKEGEEKQSGASHEGETEAEISENQGKEILTEGDDKN